MVYRALAWEVVEAARSSCRAVLSASMPVPVVFASTNTRHRSRFWSGRTLRPMPVVVGQSRQPISYHLLAGVPLGRTAFVVVGLGIQQQAQLVGVG